VAGGDRVGREGLRRELRRLSAPAAAPADWPHDANDEFVDPMDPIASPGGAITYTWSKFDAAQILAGGSGGGDGTYRLCAWLTNTADGNTYDPSSAADVVAGPATTEITLTGAGPGLLFPRIYGSYYWRESAAGLLTLTTS
jgi:hypothetical protein